MGYFPSTYGNFLGFLRDTDEQDFGRPSPPCPEVVGQSAYGNLAPGALEWGYPATRSPGTELQGFQAEFERLLKA